VVLAAETGVQAAQEVPVEVAAAIVLVPLIKAAMAAQMEEMAQLERQMLQTAKVVLVRVLLPRLSDLVQRLPMLVEAEAELV